MGPGAAGRINIAGPADGGDRRVGREAFAAASESAPVVSQLAEGSDRHLAARAGPPGTATLPLAGPRGSGEQTGSGAAVFEIDPARGPLSLASTPVDCNPGWWQNFRVAWVATLAERAQKSPRVRIALNRKHEEIAADCGTSLGVLACGCKVQVVPWRCDEKMVCPTCRTRYYKRIRRRMLGAVEQIAREHPRDHWVFIRLSMRQEGSIEDRRQLHQRAWQRFRAWMYKRLGYAVPYAAIAEVTPGRTAAGNLHWHVLMRLPFIAYAEIHREWVRATDGAACGLAGCDGSDQAHAGDAHSYIGSRVDQCSGGSGAAAYVSKYASKGIEPSKMSPQLAGQLLGAFYWRRWVQTSRRWWIVERRVCPCCDEPYQVLDPWYVATLEADGRVVFPRGPPVPP